MSSICVVTGGAGFIGSAVSGTLVGRFDRVIAIDNLHPQVHPEAVRPAMLHKAVALVTADITRQETWDRLLREFSPNVVVHLAAETGTGQSLTEATRHATVNVVGTAQMLDAFARHRAFPCRMVLASSRAVYGEGAWQDARTGETVYPGQRSRAQLERREWDFPGLRSLSSMAGVTEPRPTSVYGATKLAQEHMIRSWALSFGVEAAILRLQNAYGPGQSLHNSYTGIVSLFARLSREGKSIPIYEDGLITRDFVFIEDVADAVCRAACDGAPSQIPYDIGSGQTTTVLRLGELVAATYGAPAPELTGEFRNGDVRHAACDIGRTRAELLWQPQWTLEQGIAALCRWIEETSPPPLSSGGTRRMPSSTGDPPR
jgi:dTDP-L-rhamnose 4-epimerase